MTVKVNKIEFLFGWKIWGPPTLMAFFLVIVAQFDFLTFHTLAEFCAIVVSFLLVAFAWSSHGFSKNNFLLFLASGYFWIGSLDLIHTLVYKGMNLYVEGSAALTVQFWIGTRYLEAALLLAAPFAAAKKQNGYLLFVVFGTIAVAVTTLIITGNFPTSFIEGQGLTKFKIYSEYAIIFILAVALLTLFRFGHEISSKDKTLIAASIVLTMGAELAFTFYVSVYGLSNLVGHIFKLYSYWFIFQAVVYSNLQKPFYELKNLTDYNHLLFNNSPIGLFLCRLDGTLVEVNTTYADILGRSVDETRALDQWQITPRIYETQEQLQLDALKKNGTYGPYEKEFIHCDGHLIPVQLSGKIMELGGERFIWSSVENITARKTLEEQVRRSQKMDAVGQLTGGIAHDFNNILGIVMGNLEILEDNLRGDDAALARVQEALKGIDRGAEITRKLLGFSRKNSTDVSVTAVNTLLLNLEDLIAKSLTASVQVETRLSENIWRVAIDPGDLEDTILNLSLNARDAMPQGGRLVIETANKTLDEAYENRNPEARAGEFVMISVSDTGKGMSKEVKERMFEPFFTTKEPGKGTGLGLSMVYGFAKRSGGHLKIYSEVGKGTTIRLFLPRSMKVENLHSSKNEMPIELSKRHETILIVDDEEVLRDVAAAHLEGLGYEILKAENGEEAKNIFRQTPQIDLLFSDVVLPGGVDGYQLAWDLQEEKPSLKILLTSGFSKAQNEDQRGKEPFVTTLNKYLLPKPYNKFELATAVHATLERDRKRI